MVGCVSEPAYFFCLAPGGGGGAWGLGLRVVVFSSEVVSQVGHVLLQVFQSLR